MFFLQTNKAAAVHAVVLEISWIML